MFGATRLKSGNSDYLDVAMRSIIVQVRQGGAITLAAKLRKRYNLEVGDTLTLLDLQSHPRVVVSCYAY